ncbi:MAG: metallophosphoesterase [Candidatus Omnitrophica bacterium]|nr:metallophosphoesterase [Candidatus Omnitrophota bacterium]
MGIFEVFPSMFILKLGIVAFYIGLVVMILWTVLKLIRGHYQKTGERKWQRVTAWLNVIILSPVIMPIVFGPIIGYYAYKIEPNWIEVTEQTFIDERFPKGIEDLTIVQISDLHTQQYGQREQRLVSKVNRLRPDIILINGDFINDQQGWEPVYEVLAHLKAKRAVYAILGNTDYYYGRESQIIDRMKGVGIEVLTHRAVKVEVGLQKHFWIVGLSERWGQHAYYGHVKYVDLAFEGVPVEDAKILMVHDPVQADMPILNKYNPQLILAGDNHGGQVGIPFLRHFSDYANRPYLGGTFYVQDRPLYVNRGIGVKTLPLRFLCRPEITVVKLRKN